MHLLFFRTTKNGLNFENLAKIAHKIAKPRHFVNTENEPDSPINFLSSDMYFVEVGFLLQKLSGEGMATSTTCYCSRPLLFAKVCINVIVGLGNAKESKLTSNDCVTIRTTVLFSLKTNIINRK